MPPRSPRNASVLPRIVPLVAALVATTIGLAASAEGTARTAACGTGWHEVSIPNPSSIHNFFNAVAAIAPDDVWAVGGRLDGTTQQTLIEHWDGTAWSIIPSPSRSRFSRLSGVSAVGPDDVWAVGASSHQVLTEHWDGSAWSIVASPFPGDLQDVAAISPTNVLAVGSEPGPHEQQPLALRWTGSGWLKVHADVGGDPDPDGFDSVTALRAADAWAVGNGLSDNNETQTHAQHWNGSAFSAVATPTPGRGFDYLLGVDAVASDDAWSVGESFGHQRGSATRTLTERWDGASWTIVPSPNRHFAGYEHFDNRLMSVDAVDADEVWAVGTARGFIGDSFSGTSTRFRTLALEWDGHKWRIVSSPNASDIRNSELRDVSALPDGHVWAAGAASSASGREERPLILARC